MISIVIPSLNEEKYIGLLLESIKNQNFKDYEIILADAGSNDKTVEIAKKYGCIITSGGLPAKGRNDGAKFSKGELLFFLDSDVVLPDDFFEKVLLEFNQRNLDIASFALTPFPKSRLSKMFLDFFYNAPIIFLEKIIPHAATGIIVRKKIFQKINGFDEDIKLAEDMDFARRAVKLAKAKFGIIRDKKIFVSDRRFKKDGWFSTGIKFLLCELYMIFIGPVKSDIFKYRFGGYDKKHG